MSKGYIYILSNPSMPDLVKIGRSINGGRDRAKQINQTGVPSPFILEMEILTHFHEDAEINIHDALSHCRESENREFFRMDVEDAIAAVINEVSVMHIMRISDSILDEDVIAEFSWKLNKAGIDSHPFQVATALNYLNIDAVISAMKKYKEAGKKRLERIEKLRKNNLEVVNNG